MAECDPEQKKPEEVAMEEGNAENASSGDAAGNIAAQLMQNPQMLAAVQGKLNTMVGMNSGYIASLPKEVKRRIKALKKLQSKMNKIESEFYQEVHKLECKYAVQYDPLFNKRSEIVQGSIEPTDSDCEWEDDEELNEDGSESVVNNMKKLQVNEETPKAENNGEKTEESEPVNGIPCFWLTIFKNVDMLSEMVQEADEPILQTLQDIKLKVSPEDPMGFTLEFHFGENEYFTNKMLTKEYILRGEPDEADPLGFEGPEIVKCVGCKIDWKKGKNVTVKLIKKIQKHKGRGTKRTITKEVQTDSFFNFFAPPEPTDDDEEDEDTEALLAADFEIGHFIRERIVPRAILYFTGEALEDDDYDEEEEMEGEEGEEEDDDEENDADFVPPSGGDKPADCKQQ